MASDRFSAAALSARSFAGAYFHFRDSNFSGLMSRDGSRSLFASRRAGKGPGEGKGGGMILSGGKRIAPRRRPSGTVWHPVAPPLSVPRSPPRRARSSPPAVLDAETVALGRTFGRSGSDSTDRRRPQAACTERRRRRRQRRSCSEVPSGFPYPSTATASARGDPFGAMPLFTCGRVVLWSIAFCLSARVRVRAQPLPRLHFTLRLVA